MANFRPFAATPADCGATLKLPNCRIILNAGRMRQVLARDGHLDSTFRTWLHESFHARQRYATDATTEYRRAPGFEEGLAEGLTRLLIQQLAGIALVETQYTGYVAAYQALAAVLATDLETLLRALWRHPTGRVMEAFVSEVDALGQRAGREPLSRRQQLRLLGVGIGQFQPAPIGSDAALQAEVQRLTAIWDEALR